MDINLVTVNEFLHAKTPKEIIEWAVSIAKKPIVTTNFRPYEAVILHACTQVKKDMEVVWCDTGYNTLNTYNHANKIIELLNLNIKLFVPQQTTAYRDAKMGIPGIDDPKHKDFTYQVKLEPFKRAMNEIKPDIWFTNLRKGQTAFRDSIDVVSQSKDGLVKVSPFFNFSDQEMDKYIDDNGLENETKYFDPTKVLGNRECGLHA